MPVALVHQVDIKAPSDAVYKAISTQAGLSSFWTDETEASAKVGSIATFGFGGPTQRMRIEKLIPGKHIQWTGLPDFPNWGDTSVSWEIKPAPNGGSSLTFRHANWPAAVTAEDLGSINYTWGLIVERLKRYAETGQPVPYFAVARR